MIEIVLFIFSSVKSTNLLPSPFSSPIILSLLNNSSFWFKAFVYVLGSTKGIKPCFLTCKPNALIPAWVKLDKGVYTPSFKIPLNWVLVDILDSKFCFIVNKRPLGLPPWRKGPAKYLHNLSRSLPISLTTFKIQWRK